MSLCPIYPICRPYREGRRGRRPYEGNCKGNDTKVFVPTKERYEDDPCDKVADNLKSAQIVLIESNAPDRFSAIGGQRLFKTLLLSN
jgi:hypothetical protein